MSCDLCAEERAAGAAFCENCGRPLATGAARSPGTDCGACGSAGAVGADGYCENCGMLAARPGDHRENDHGEVAAAVSDRGLRHHRNEDAMWLAVRGTDVDVVVCDGVSASFDPDVASATAAETAGRALASDVCADAVLAAAAAVAGLAATGDPRRASSNPACTIVAATVRDGAISYSWVGDSRAYWVPDDPGATPLQLTEDDSWAACVIAAGVDPEIAWNNPKAHAITAWLGADAGEVKPRSGHLSPGGPGTLVVCSDGLWNYLTSPDAFGAAVRSAAGAGGGPIGAARALVALANEAGGSDNITVALVPSSGGSRDI